MDLSLGYLDSSLDSVDDLITDDTVTITTDNELPFSPELQAALGLSYHIPVGTGEVFLRGDWMYMDDQYYSISNLPEVFQESYSRFNASVSYRPESQTWQLILGVKNLTDEEYNSGAATTFTNGGHAMASVARPRTAFATFNYYFGDD